MIRTDASKRTAGTGIPAFPTRAQFIKFGIQCTSKTLPAGLVQFSTTHMLSPNSGRADCRRRPGANPVRCDGIIINGSPMLMDEDPSQDCVGGASVPEVSHRHNAAAARHELFAQALMWATGLILSQITWHSSMK
jgi:hypothetical protein